MYDFPGMWLALCEAEWAHTCGCMRCGRFFIGRLCTWREIGVWVGWVQNKPTNEWQVCQLGSSHWFMNWIQGTGNDATEWHLWQLPTQFMLASGARQFFFVRSMLKHTTLTFIDTPSNWYGTAQAHTYRNLQLENLTAYWFLRTVHRTTITCVLLLLQPRNLNTNCVCHFIQLFMHTNYLNKIKCVCESTMQIESTNNIGTYRFGPNNICERRSTAE